MSILINEVYANPTTPLWAAAGGSGGDTITCFFSDVYQDSLKINEFSTQGFVSLVNSNYDQAGALYRLEMDMLIEPGDNPIISPGYLIPSLQYRNISTSEIYTTTAESTFIDTDVALNTRLHLTLNFVSNGGNGTDYVDVWFTNTSPEQVWANITLSNVCITKLTNTPPINNPYA